MAVVGPPAGPADAARPRTAAPRDSCHCSLAAAPWLRPRPYRSRYHSIVDRFDIGATASAGNGSMSRSHSSHRVRNSASRSGCFSKDRRARAGRIRCRTGTRARRPSDISSRPAAPPADSGGACANRASARTPPPPGQDRQQIDPVKRVSGSAATPGRGEAGGGQIHRDADLVGHRPGRCGPATSRSAAPEPALQQVEFAADKRPDFRKPFAAIVAGEHDQRIVAARALPDRIEHAADAGIENLHHFAIDAGLAAFGDLGAHGLALARRLLDRGRRPGPVRRRVVQAQKIRFRPRRRFGDPSAARSLNRSVT